MKRAPFLFIAAMLIASGATALAETSSADVGWQIRREAIERSQIMKTLHVLTDVYGPRLTGSPNLKQAGEWAAHQLEQWGLVNAHLEPWNFGHPGWLNERFTAHITSPVKDALVGEVLAWTPSTAGVVRAGAMQLSPPERPTAEALTAFLDSVGNRVTDRIVLVGPPKAVGVTILPPAKRLDDNEAKARFDPVNPTPSPFANQAPVVPPTGQLTANQVNERLRRLPRGAPRGRPGQRRRPRSRTDPRIQQPHVRRRENRRDHHPAQRGLRPHLRACWPISVTYSSRSKS